MNLTSLKQNLKCHESSPSCFSTAYMNLRAPPRRERCMLFAELSSQGGRSTPTPLLFPTVVDAYCIAHARLKQALVRDLWMWSTPASRRALSHSPVRTEHTPIDLTHTLSVLLISGARLHLGAGPRLPTPRAVSAHGRTPNQHHFRDSSSCSSIRHVCGGLSNRFSRLHHSSRSHHSIV